MNKNILKKFSKQQLIDYLFKKRFLVKRFINRSVFDCIKKGDTGVRTKCTYDKNYNTTKINYYKVTKNANIKKYIYKNVPVFTAINWIVQKIMKIELLHL